MGSVNGAKGKRYKPKLIRIAFEAGHQLEDLEAVMRPASIDDVMELMSVAELAEEMADGSAAAAGLVTDAHRKAVSLMVGKVARLVTSWNVDDPVTGEPVDPDEAGVRSQDFAMVFALFEAWAGQLIRVPPPLPQGSPRGPDLSGIPVQTLSPASPLS